MFHPIPERVLVVMKAIEETERTVERSSRSASSPSNVPAVVGKLLAILAVGSPAGGKWLELGTSHGYSALWISLACRAVGTRLTTVEKNPEKVKIARANFARAEIDDIVDVVEADSLEVIRGSEPLSFCFMDAGGGVGSHDLIVPKLKPGGLLVYDHTRGNRDREGSPYEHALADERVDCVVVPIGGERERTELVCRRVAF